MNPFEVLSIAEDYRIEVCEKKHSYSIPVQTEVERIWKKEKEARGDALYNGKLLSLLSMDATCLVGEVVDYKHFLAQHSDPSLFEKIKIVPVAVTGIVSVENKYLIGKRSKRVLTHQGLMEFVPSGGVEQGIMQSGTLYPSQQLLLELFEETGMELTVVEAITPFAVIKQGIQGPVDICAHIRLNPQALQHAAFPANEHLFFEWKTKEELYHDISKNPTNYVPLTIELIKFFLS